jgi:urease accessory protein
MELVFARRRGRTVLASAYAEPPFRVGACFPDGDGLRMILATCAPGIFGGDRLEQTVRVEPGARVHLATQSSLQVHPIACADRAVLISAYDVADAASLACELHPVIPFAASRFEQRIRIDVAPAARMFWSDGLMAGRQACGERWMFAALAHELRFSRGGTLEYLERYTMAPQAPDGGPTGAWLAGDAAYLGTMLATDVAAAADQAERLHAMLAGRSGIAAAADRPSDRLLLVRLMARDGAAFHEARALLSRWHQGVTSGS